MVNAVGRRYLVNWANVTLPFDEGGFGLRELQAWNKANSMKLVADVVL